jgi:hypothetical protein
VDGTNDDELPGTSKWTTPCKPQTTKRKRRRKSDEIVIQFDGANDSASDDEDEDEDEDDFDNIPVAGMVAPSGADQDEQEGEVNLFLSRFFF